jgi:hypothetical protein
MILDVDFMVSGIANFNFQNACIPIVQGTTKMCHHKLQATTKAHQNVWLQLHRHNTKTNNKSIVCLTMGQQKIVV